MRAGSGEKKENCDSHEKGISTAVFSSVGIGLHSNRTIGARAICLCCMSRRDGLAALM